MQEDQNRPEGNRDDVGTSPRLAGGRKAVPQERFDRVRATAYDLWVHETRSHSRRRAVWGLVGLAAAASLTAILLLRFVPAEVVTAPELARSIRVEALIGQVQVRDDSSGPDVPFRRLTVGELIGEGSEFETSAEGRAALRIASGHSLRLDTATRIRWLGGESFALVNGAIYVDSGPAARPAVPVEIRTPFGAVHDRGTQFEVRLQPESVRMRLREGAVVLVRDDGVHDVAAGTELEVTVDGSATEWPISPSGPEWNWVVAIAPVPDFEGRSVLALLEWVVRERGWELEFTDESLAQSADAVRLDGSISQLEADQLLPAVLPTCRMIYRVERGTLIVSDERENRPQG